MPAPKTVFICQSCGANFPKWQGQCSHCGQWNSLVETILAASKSRGGGSRVEVTAKPQELSQISTNFQRIKTGVFEFDRVFGGGIVPGSINLLAGEPGIGKSTLLLEVASRIAAGITSESTGDQSMAGTDLGRVLYVCGEESPEQIKSRAQRLGIVGKGLELLPETDVDVISGVVASLGAKRIRLLVVDSVQTLTTEDLTGGAGSIGQVRECAERLRRMAKQQGISIILVGHVTKGGGVAGPKVLEHLVDGVFTLEGDRFHNFRVLRSLKNRFGSTFEVGVFEMGETGLTEVKNPSALFLAERNLEAAGSVVTATLEGTRPVLMEIQALAVGSKFKYPRLAASGFSLERLQLLAAILEKRADFDLQARDIYVNVASGFKVFEPAADLAVCLALASSLLEIPLDSRLCVFGEVGLVGEVRSVPQLERRRNEAERLGFGKVLAPPEVKTLFEALSKVGLIKNPRHT